ncbi:hypothetical protein Q7C36_006890 [Tachysurus vachellii]|uniref:Uncharacterized protein n=1 Tax=Tachysurus vachellii TaxID=175792 RepID=A0AA88T5U8_TACVA|nr:hypothetical protein Q7C36_006890 [Tachysurus vachellii]
MHRAEEAGMQMAPPVPYTSTGINATLYNSVGLMKMITGAASLPMTSDQSFNHAGIVNQGHHRQPLISLKHWLLS